MPFTMPLHILGISKMENRGGREEGRLSGMDDNEGLDLETWTCRSINPLYQNPAIIDN